MDTVIAPSISERTLSVVDRAEEKAIPLDRTVLRIIFEAMEVFGEVHSAMPVAQVKMFIAVALNEGLSQTELAEITGLKKSTASRYLLDLSDRTRAGGEGFGLVQRETDPAELRKNMYALSPKGRTLVKRLTIKKGR